MPPSPDPALWLRRAVARAVANVENGGGPFGAVIVKGGELVAEGANLVTASHDPTAHAEVTAIRRAATKLNTHDLSGCEIYSSCEPCPMCLGAIFWARLDRIYYAATQLEAAAAGFDDAHFYQQLALPPTQRQIAMHATPIPGANDPFLAWRRFSAKVPY
jgi:tRNA(Arg) A34 adenosine deaminase TadA